ncbi:MAG: hypothetical protein LBB23_00715 [Rickettsiales bacterium]|jgi:hypothetical protein|nr:hypothetical protein [Rickettsiales bacterium]
MTKLRIIFIALISCFVLTDTQAVAPSRENSRTTTTADTSQTTQSRSAAESPPQRRRGGGEAAGVVDKKNQTTQSRSATTQPRSNIARSAATNNNVIPRLDRGISADKSRSALRRAPDKNPNDLKPLLAPRSVLARAATTATPGTSFGDADYNTCKDAYMNCMDQFCGEADDTYHRCICSNKVVDLQARAAAVESATAALQNFIAVDTLTIGLDAEDAVAMFNATEGELAVPKGEDKSAFAGKLDDIANQLLGASSSKSPAKKSAGSKFTTIDLNDLSADLFGGNKGASVDVNLTGDSLYNNVHLQCSDMVGKICSQKNIGLVVSLYKQGINKDCDAAAKSMKAKEDNVKKGVTNTQVALMEARLEAHESRNSLSDLECLEDALKRMTDDLVCGKDYSKCLDFSGQYIDSRTGNPIYTPKFGHLADWLTLPDTTKNQMTMRDVPANAVFINKLDEMRIFIEKDVLKNCQSVADRIWGQVVDRALIEIKNAQRDKVDQVRDQCIAKLGSCLDVQTGAFDGLRDIVEGTPTTASPKAGEDVLKGRDPSSPEAVDLALVICEELKKSCISVYGDVFGQYLEDALSRTRAICTSTLKGKWTTAADGTQQCHIIFQ